MTMEGVLIVAKLLLLGVLFGFSFTVGVWAFCRASSWAPVNITVNNYQREANDD